MTIPPDQSPAISSNAGYSPAPFWHIVVSGGIAGVVTDCSLFPIDTVKTRMQSPEGAWRTWKGLYNGVTPAAVASFPAAAIFFGVYELLKPLIPGDSPLSHACAGAGAEAASCLFRVPFEVVKQRLQAGTHPHDCAKPYKLVKYIWKTEGIRGIYAGFNITTGKEIAFTIIQMPIYEHLRKSILSYTGKTSPSFMESALCGACAGVIAAAVTCPLDVWKTRLMLGDRHATLSSIYRAEGLGALFKGVFPRCAWIGLGGMIYFGVYEEVKKLLSY